MADSQHFKLRSFVERCDHATGKPYLRELDGLIEQLEAAQREFVRIDGKTLASLSEALDQARGERDQFKHLLAESEGYTSHLRDALFRCEEQYQTARDLLEETTNWPLGGGLMLRVRRFLSNPATESELERIDREEREPGHIRHGVEASDPATSSEGGVLGHRATAEHRLAPPSEMGAPVDLSGKPFEPFPAKEQEA